MQGPQLLGNPAVPSRRGLRVLRPCANIARDARPYAVLGHGLQRNLEPFAGIYEAVPCAIHQKICEDPMKSIEHMAKQMLKAVDSMSFQTGIGWATRL